MSNPATTRKLQDNSKDLTATPIDEARLFDEANKSAEDLIRMVMVEEKREESLDALPDLAPAPEQSKKAPVKHPRRLFKPRAARTSIKPKRQGPGVVASVKNRLRSPAGRLTGAIAGYRPTRKHMFFAAVAVIFVIRPWLIPITLFIAFWVVLIGYLTLGPDRVAELVVAAWQRLHARRPDLAETIRQRAEAMALRIDANLDRLPGKWTEGLYVPDFSKPEDDAVDRPDPFERLAKEAQHG